MIEKSEINQIAKDLLLSPDTVEKDYVLGWMLYGINQHEAFNDWAFKGGTSLKKCFFDTFRFSEDLDFSLTSNEHLSEDFLRQSFFEITDVIHEETGIEFFQDMFKFDVIDKGNGRHSCQGKVNYRGPNGRPQGASIKLDLTTDEVIVENTEVKRVDHPYSDEPIDGIHINCYSFNEVVAEKVRALAQRIRPRDLYDVVHFFRNRSMIENPKQVLVVLDEKCRYKGMERPTFQYIENHELLAELKPQWENMLKHQLPSLPPMETFWQDLEPFFNWLEGHLVEEALETSPIISGERIRFGRPGSSTFNGSHIHTIQYAAANRICIKLLFDNKPRTVEPISFRKNLKNGNELFFGFEREAGHEKFYRINKIQDVQLTNLPYNEKSPVEISATGAISMPPLRQPDPVRQAPSLRPRRTRNSTSSISQYPYKVQCPYCQKTFPRKDYSNRKINKHMNHGYQCPGSGKMGFPV